MKKLYKKTGLLITVNCTLCSLCFICLSLNSQPLFILTTEMLHILYTRLFVIPVNCIEQIEHSSECVLCEIGWHRHPMYNIRASQSKLTTRYLFCLATVYDLGITGANTADIPTIGM